MPRINPIVLRRILLKAHEEIYQLYLQSTNDKISTELLAKSHQLEKLILQISKIC